MAEIIDGKELAKKVRKELKVEVDKLKEQGINPKLAVIMVGNDPGSTVYVRNKSKACEKVGIEFEEFLFEETISEEMLLETIEKLTEEEMLNIIKDEVGVLPEVGTNGANVAYVIVTFLVICGVICAVIYIKKIKQEDC